MNRGLIAASSTALIVVGMIDHCGETVRVEGDTRDADDDTVGRLRAVVEELAVLDRTPCSRGEHEAALRIRARLKALGVDACIEGEQVHGTYFQPLGIATAAAAAAGLLPATRAGRLAAALVGTLAAAAIAEDLAGVPRRRLREQLRHAPSMNVVGEIGPRDAAQTLVICAHHDAARTSFIFDPALPRYVMRRWPQLMERLDRWPPLMALVIAGPLLVAAAGAAGSRGLMRFAAIGSAMAATVMAHMSRQPAVPGANDNLSAVAAIVELARRLAGDPPDGVRIVLLSTGAEEANQAGMVAFAARHLDAMDPASTSFLCLDSIGSPELALIEGEGFLQMLDYSPALRERIAAAARDVCVPLRRGTKITFATDALVPLRRGFEAVSIVSFDAHLAPSNYHLPSDTPENLDYGSVLSAVDVVEAVARSFTPGR